MADIFALFTKDARSVLDNAKQIAKTHKQPLVTANHLLMGVLNLSGCQAEKTLAEFRFNLESLRTRTAAYIKLNGRREAKNTSPGYTDRKIKLSVDSAAIINEAALEARENELDFVDTRMIILGMLREPGNSAGQLLQQYGVSLERFREAARLNEAPLVDTPQPGKLKQVGRGIPLGVSPIFLLLLGLTALFGYLAYAGIGNDGVTLFFFVTGGWIISVGFHEFGHALAAWLGGDKSVADKGYLSLNPLKYTHPFLSIVLPIVFLIMGGIPLPGGAVYINYSALKNDFIRSLTSAAGPAATLMGAVVCAAPFVVGISFESYGLHFTFWAGVALLAFIQVFAFFLNLLPIPGLDGFGILEPFLPPNIVRQLAFVRSFSLILLVVLFIYTPFGSRISEGVWQVLVRVNEEMAYLAVQGFELYRFWS